jgi:K+-sensing histidine kinase KdpD
VNVVRSAGEAGTGSSRAAVARHLDFARRLHIETRTLEAHDAAAALVAFARANAVTQIFVPRPARRWLSLLSRRHTAMRVVALAHDMQVTVVAERKKTD